MHKIRDRFGSLSSVWLRNQNPMVEILQAKAMLLGLKYSVASHIMFKPGVPDDLKVYCDPSTLEPMKYGDLVRTAEERWNRDKDNYEAEAREGKAQTS